jgi:hypothetical protein
VHWPVAVVWPHYGGGWAGGGSGAAGAASADRDRETEQPATVRRPAHRSTRKFTCEGTEGKNPRHAHHAVRLDLRQQREQRVDHRDTGKVELVVALLGEDLGESSRRN